MLQPLVDYLDSVGLNYESSGPTSLVVTLVGEHKLRTSVLFVVGAHALTVNAFVARRPEQNEAVVHQWLLERNRRMYAVAFSIDHLGDIYLTGRMPVAVVNDKQELDRLLGCILDYADGSFNTLLELGFPDAIRREWQWRVSRGESTANLAAFAHLVDQPADPAPTA
jgi:hypothetical protein